VLHLANCTGQLWKLKELLVSHAVKEHRASSPCEGLLNYTNKRKMLRGEYEEMFVCAPDLNEIHNHSAHKEFGKYIYIAYYIQPLYSVCANSIFFFQI